MIVFMVIFVFMVLLGAFSLAYQIFRLVVADAQSRGLKHPVFWGIFSTGGSNGSGGLLLYLLGRNKYPSNMSGEQKAVFNSRKKRAGLSLCFICFGTAGLLLVSLFGNL